MEPVFHLLPCGHACSSCPDCLAHPSSPYPVFFVLVRVRVVQRLWSRGSRSPRCLWASMGTEVRSWASWSRSEMCSWASWPPRGSRYLHFLCLRVSLAERFVLRLRVALPEVGHLRCGRRVCRSESVSSWPPRGSRDLHVLRSGAGCLRCHRIRFVLSWRCCKSVSSSPPVVCSSLRPLLAVSPQLLVVCTPFHVSIQQGL